MYRLMVVDDEQNILNAIRRITRKELNWEVEFYDNPVEALKRAHGGNYELFLSDFRMPVMDGVKFLSETKHIHPDAMRVILSGYTDLEALLGAINEAEIFRFISKPWMDYDLITTLQQALSLHDMLIENRTLADEVRAQRVELANRKTALERLMETNPVLAHVEWTEDGSIILE
jgi:DNA-binding NtrC family response regulator